MAIIKFFPVLFLLLSLLTSVKAHAQLPGKYIYYSAAGENLKDKSTIILNCNNTFLAEDTGFKVVAMGTWRVKKQKLILHTDSSIMHSKTRKNPTTTTYSIQEEGLHIKVMTKRQYKRMIRRWNKLMPEPGYFEDYEKVKELEENRFYKMIDPFNCL